MLGAIAGDIIGSVYEWANNKTKNIKLLHGRSRFTDDTVLTIATADALLNGQDYVDAYHHYYWRYPLAGYGAKFTRWATLKQRQPYYSWGNGSAMRISPVSYVFPSLEAVLNEAARSAAVTHNHPEGIKGAQAVAAAIFLARTGSTKEQISLYIEQQFGYDLTRSLDEIRPTYHFDVSCQGSVPEAIIAFLESTDFEDALRNAISIGGDSDTIACIAGGIAEAFYGGVPASIQAHVFNKLDPHLKQVTQSFCDRWLSI